MSNSTQYIFEKHRRIEAELREHHNAGREISRIARHMHADSHTARVNLAQKACINYVADACKGDAKAFLGKYASGEIDFVTIVMHAGRMALGLPAEQGNHPKIYS